MDFISPLLTIIKEYLADPLTRHASYALKVKTKIETLRNEMSSLSVVERDVARKVDAARARLLNPFDLVIVWQEKAKNLKQEADGIINVIINGCSPNFVSRYKLGKRATQLLLVVKDFKEEGIRFSEGAVVDPTLPLDAEVNFKALREEVNTLTRIEADVVSLVNNAKWSRGLQPKHQVEGWLLTVANHKLTVDSIYGEFEQMKEHCDLDTNNWVTISVNLQNTLEKIKALISEGRCFTDEKNVIDPSRPLAVIQQSMIPSIGQDNACHDTLKFIQDDDVRLIGIYGMGGAGKTTLLKRINNSLDGIGYEIVIFVVVSGNVNIEAIQRDILKRFGKSLDQGSASTLEMGNMIRNRLHDEKFILMLDDIRKELDLEEVGLPIYANKKNYKILFTTRDESVCDQMKAIKVKIECLNNEEAWKLFETTVGETILNSNPRIKKLGELVAKECGGLPLALTVIGGAMRSKRTIPEWSDALSTLRKFEPELTGTLDKLYMRLRFSYENLASDIMKECFCYCALFPEDWSIDTHSLIDCWIGEGFFECETIENARNKGYAIIADLIRACLLVGVENDLNSEYEFVKMHDVVRDIALWIKKDKYVVFPPGTEAPKIDKRGKVEMMSLTTSQELGNLFEPGSMFSNLSTLLIMTTECLRMMREEFFLSFPNLHVLHFFAKSNELVSWSFPSSTWRPTQLRYFDSGGISVSHGKNFGLLTSLEILKAPIHFDFSSIDGSVSRLAHLRVLHIDMFSVGLVGLDVLGLKIADLKLLARLEDLNLPICTISFLRDLAACPELAHCVSGLCLIKSDIKTCRLTVEVGSMDRIERIAFRECESLEEIIIEKEDYGSSKKCLQNLKSFQIFGCRVLRKLYLDKTLPQLELIRITHCWLMPELFSSRSVSVPYVFPELQKIILWRVGMDNICSDTFLFPRLKIFDVWLCERLRKLPKGIIEANLKKIISDKEWWDKLEWESEKDKMSLIPLWERNPIDIPRALLRRIKEAANPFMKRL